ncbi:MAG: hypothetical protein ABH846_00195 [Patescibacteria group bacterium]
MKKAIEAAVSLAYTYLLGTKWVEFSAMRHGPSTAADWVGGFIRRCLPDLPGFDGQINFRFSAKSSTDFDSEINWAKFTGEPTRGWYHHLDCHGYGHPNFSLVGLATFNYDEVKAMYPLPEKDTHGWIKSQFEVTALALQCDWWKPPGIGSLNWYTNGAYSYLAECFKTRTDTSYWWSTNAYGWHQVAELDLEQHFDLKCWLYERLQASDPLSNRYGEICPFTMALSLMTALKVEPNHPSIQSLAELLLETQQADGSWRSPAILRIPKPNVVKPTLGCRRAAEDKGLLTTATITQALKRFANHCGKSDPDAR